MLQSFKKSMLAIVIALSIVSIPLLANSKDDPVANQNDRVRQHINGTMCIDEFTDNQEFESGYPLHQGFMGGEMDGRRKRIHQVKNKKMVSILELEGDAEDKALEITNKFDESKFELMQEMRLTTEELKVSLKREAGSKASTEYANKLENLHRKMFDLNENYKKDMKNILTTKQYNLFIYFDAVFEREVVRGMRERQERQKNDYQRRRRF